MSSSRRARLTDTSVAVHDDIRSVRVSLPRNAAPTTVTSTQGSTAPVCRAGSLDSVLRITESRLERYTCPQSTFNSTDPARPGPVQGVYNELASLMDVPGEALLQSGLVLER